MPPPARALLMTSAVAETRDAGFIVSRLYDSVFFIFSPLLALGLVAVLAQWTWALNKHTLLGVVDQPIPFFITVWTLGHSFAVVFRSHANPEIFVQHRFRFVGVPILLYVALMLSDWVMVSGLVLAVAWALYHASMQNFGLCRIYDARWGNAPDMGRQLDYWLNLFLLFGPILWGVNMVTVFFPLRHFSQVGWNAPALWLRDLDSMRYVIADVVFAAGAIFLALYVFAYWRLTKRGYRLCPQKIMLLLTSATAWIVAYGFLSAWKAFFVLNFFHALQYFAIVWWSEKRNIRRIFRLENVSSGPWLALLGFASSVVFVGIVCRVYGEYTLFRWTGALTIVIALMHYWYDGFVWSVRKHQV